MDLVEFRAFVTVGIGAWLFYGTISDSWRGVTLFHTWRDERPWRFWLLVMAQLVIFGGIAAYGVAQYRIAKGLMAPLGLFGL